MSLKSTVETLGRTAVTTTFSVVRHPVGTAARAAGLAKDTAGAGLGLVRGRGAQGRTQGQAQDPTQGHPEATSQDTVAEVTKTVLTSVAQVVETVAEKAEDISERVEPAAPVAQKAAAVKTAAAEKATPAAKKPAAKKPAAKKPASKKPAAKVPAPADGKAATGEPVVEKVSTSSTDDTAKKASAEKPVEDPRDHIPGPDLVTFAPPAPEDLPEPIVIEAE